MMHKRIENGTQQSFEIFFWFYAPIRISYFKFNELHATKFVGSLSFCDDNELIAAFAGKRIM